LGFFTSTGIFSIQTDIFSPSSRIVISFVRTANRLNAAHILTQTEFDEAQTNNGQVEIDVGEYVFDAIAVTDTQEDITTELTEEEIAAIEGQQSESDRAFRKLFEQNIPDARNRLIGVRVNLEGIEYRLDNGGPKAVSAMDSSGQGFFVGSGAANNYRDGSSRKLLVDISKEITREGTNQTTPLPGDVLYLSYIAVKEHYIRQSVNVKWALAAQSIPPQCFGYPTDLKYAAFRFYEWNITDDEGSNVRLAGWRAVETDNVPVNYIAPMRDTNNRIVLGDFIIGARSGLISTTYLPANVTLSQLQAYIDNRSTLPSYQVNLNQPAGGANFHINAGAEGSQFAYENSDWYNRGLFYTYDTSYDAQQKIFFNVHPNAMNKRDVDKFGVDRVLAQELEQDVAAGKRVFVPFMDDPDPEFPAPTDGAKTFLDNSNMKFDPIQPVSIWNIGNAEIECATGGGVALGFQSGFNGFGDVMGAFGVNSNIITERFEKDTRILVEMFATEGEFGPDILAIEGLVSPRGAITCIADRLGLSGFVVHTDEDNLLRFMRYKNQNVLDSLHDLDYRPDLPAPDIEENLDPRPEQFEGLLGYSNMLGDVPGIKPGYSVTVSAVIDKSKLRFVTTSRSRLDQLIPDLESEQVDTIEIEKEPSQITIPVSTGWHGRLLMDYTYHSDDQDFMILFKAGSSILGAIDSLRLVDSGGISDSIEVDFRWIKCDTIEIVGQDFSSLSVDFVLVSSLDNSVANDFLNEEPDYATRSADKNLISENRFYDRSVLFETDVMSLGQSNDGRMFVFFNDADGGISCAQSNDKGMSWIYHYGIVEPIRGLMARHPFVMNSYELNKAFLFYVLNGKVMCKAIPYDLFLDEDAMVVERFEQDRLVEKDDAPDEINLGVYSDKGNVLRRQQLSYVAAGDLTDVNFLSLLGKIPDEGEFEPNEDFAVEVQEGQSRETLSLRSNPVAIGSTTAFGNRDIEDSFFSVSKSHVGELCLWYMAQARDDIGGGDQLQCHFSTDHGITWFDKWEFIENGHNRIRADETQKTQFIDWSASGEPVTDILAEDPLESQQQAYWGINVHWSRLKRHKTDPTTSTGFEDDSVVMPISSPYAFFHPFLKQIFLFYIYEGCLLCKVFAEGLFKNAAERKRRRRVGDSPADDELSVGMDFVKEVIERGTRAHFIDGNLSTADIREELHYYINPETSERQVEGNIIYPFFGSMDVFNEERTLSVQRVCAYRFTQCNLRVFYKLEQSPDVRCAMWNGSVWMVEELLKSIGVAPPEVTDLSGITDVTGGFGDDGYGP
jgi:hypothetical protein